MCNGDHKHETQTPPLPRAGFERRVVNFVNNIQKTISSWLVALWCLGAFSPTIVFLLISILQPHFGLPDRRWQPLVLLAGFSASACAATLAQLSVENASAVYFWPH